MCWLGGEDFTVQDFIRHIDHVADRVGIDHVGIATDSACTDDVPRTQVLADRTNERYPEVVGRFVAKFGPTVEVRYPQGLRNLRELPLLTAALLLGGYKQTDVAKVMGLNFLRVFRAAWGD
jgi:membrane dipeptidase